MKQGKATAAIVIAIVLAIIIFAGFKFIGNTGITGAESASTSASGLMCVPSCVTAGCPANQVCDTANGCCNQPCSLDAVHNACVGVCPVNGESCMALKRDKFGNIQSCGCNKGICNAGSDILSCGDYVCLDANGNIDPYNKCTSPISAGGSGSGFGLACKCQAVGCSEAVKSDVNVQCSLFPCNANYCNGTQTVSESGGCTNTADPTKCQCSNVNIFCKKGSCGATCSNHGDCANIPGANTFVCSGNNNQIPYVLLGLCGATNCTCYLGLTKPAVPTTCGNTGENDTCGSPADQSDCNACDVAGNQQGDQGFWNAAAADQCNQDCSSYFSGLGKTHIAAGSITVNASTYQATETSCDRSDNDCNGIIDDINGSNSINSTKCGCFNGSKPTAETCNGIDDNCDGVIDGASVCNTTTNCGTYGNNCKTVLNNTNATCVNGQCIVPACSGNQSRSCYTGPANTSGVGACHNGTQICANSIWGSCAGQVLPSTEICIDKIDNNCNGLVDSPLEGCGQHNNTSPVASASVCGNGKCDANETQDTCSVDCGCPAGHELVGTTCKEKTTQPAVCGNNIAEVGEQCDGTDDTSCPAACTPDCTCLYLVGDGKCDTALGESTITSPVDCKQTNWALIIAIIVIIVGIISCVIYYLHRRKSNLNTLAQAHGVNEPVTGGDLEPVVNTMLSQGYSPAEVSQNLTNLGWSSDDIQNALASAHQDQTQLGDLAEQYGVAVPSDEIKDAEDYTKKCLDTGFTPAQIRTALMAAEWPASTVDDVLSKFTQEHVEGDAKKAGVLEPTDDVDKLKDFVKKVLDEGQTPQQIKKSLLDSGWQESALKEVLP